MGVPKRRTPSAKRDMRRSHHGLAAPNLVRCPVCRSMHQNHRPCPTCGTYRGRQVLRREEPLG
jgi:large subunit ribosomal protein L32